MSDLEHILKQKGRLLAGFFGGCREAAREFGALGAGTRRTAQGREPGHPGARAQAADLGARLHHLELLCDLEETVAPRGAPGNGVLHGHGLKTTHSGKKFPQHFKHRM